MKKNLSRDLRKRLGLSEVAWSRALGVSERTVTRWESGATPSGVASEVMRAIDLALDAGVNPTEIIAGRVQRGINAIVYDAMTRSP